MHFKCRYECEQEGDTHAVLTYGATEHEQWISGVEGNIADLVRCLTELAEGALTAAASVYSEPGEYRHIFTRHGNQLNFRVRWFENNVPFGVDPEDRGEEVFFASGRTSEILSTFATALEAQRQVLTQWYMGQEVAPEQLDRMLLAVKRHRDA